MTQAPILVGIDFSDGAACAVAMAGALAELFGVPLVACHVPEGEREPWAEWELDWLDTVGLEPESLIVREGIPWLELARLADDLGCVAVAVGSHGLNGYQPLSPGSTTAALLTRARRPVLVMPTTRNSAHRNHISQPANHPGGAQWPRIG